MLPPSNPVRLDMAAIRKRFGATRALDGVDFSIAGGEVHALVGENGAGKSTLMKILSGAERPDAGTMRLDGAPYAPRHPLDARRLGVAMIYQELALAPHLTAADNLFLGMEHTRAGWLRRKGMRDRARDAFRELGHPDLPPDVPVGRLPPARRQIVEIARALAVGGRVLVFDEPTSSLSREDAERLFAVIRMLRARGYAIVYISHVLEEVRRLADRFTVLRDGTVAGTGPVSGTSADELVRLMIGRPVDRLYPRSRRIPGEPLLEVVNLAGARLPAQVSLTLRRGEIHGVAGLVGAGRTELLRVLFGLEPVRRGTIRIGAWSGPASPARRWAQGCGLLSEDRKNEGLSQGRSVADNLTLPRLSGLGPAGLVLPGRQRAAAASWIDRLGIRCRSPLQPVGDLSGGNQQKVALARLLYHDADLLLLDEPTRGIDVGSKAQIYDLLDRLAAGSPETGIRPRALLLVSSYLPELLGLCDRIAVMRRGILSEARPATAWTEEALLRAALPVETIESNINLQPE